ncbi:MAG: secondary thiamine-phosphate synthase enzyme YjbQ [Rhodospirillales bacterium]|nr:secondary thiamine-phosphate synthase enzyme YjbQ [Rhodospirillales bacterium]
MSSLKQAQHFITVETRGQGLHEITDRVGGWVAELAMETGIVTLFCRHTSASLTIQENADPDVQRDIEAFLGRLVPESPNLYRHMMEGPDDMPAHIKSALTDVSLSIPLSAGRLVLGTWQGIFLCEHRSRPHRREVVLHATGQ